MVNKHLGDIRMLSLLSKNLHEKYTNAKTRPCRYSALLDIFFRLISAVFTQVYVYIIMRFPVFQQYCTRTPVYTLLVPFALQFQYVRPHQIITTILQTKHTILLDGYHIKNTLQ